MYSYTQQLITVSQKSHVASRLLCWLVEPVILLLEQGVTDHRLYIQRVGVQAGQQEPFRPAARHHQQVGEAHTQLRTKQLFSILVLYILDCKLI
jgi:hypothetical protein